MIQGETIKLNNGMDMPVLGFGTYLTDSTHIGKYVEQAIRVGYRLIDTAAYYHNEAAVGHSIHKSGVAREDIFLTTKVMSDGYDAT
ncbi:MAG: aldo/keto reductase, partial [Macrococcus canis]|uniref:aldo/keto reductase n=1 Tax=Macrococcoides canis TaxID=1855823 RepID=UPI002E762FD3